MKKEHKVWIIKDNEVEETTIEDLIYDYDWRDEITSPRGVEPRLHIRNETDVWSWGIGGNNPHHVATFDSSEEAEEDLWACWIESLATDDCAPSFFDSEEEAREVLFERIHYARQFEQ
jgi:hypothetical protein